MLVLHKQKFPVSEVFASSGVSRQNEIGCGGLEVRARERSGHVSF